MSPPCLPGPPCLCQLCGDTRLQPPVQQKASVPLWLCPRRGPGAWGAQPPTVTPRVASAQSLTEAWPGPMSPRWGQLPPHPGQGSDSLSGPAGHLADQVTSDGQCLTSPNPGDPPKKYFYIFFFFLNQLLIKNVILIGLGCVLGSPLGSSQLWLGLASLCLGTWSAGSGLPHIADEEMKHPELRVT
jgi:hypothetical protein